MKCERLDCQRGRQRPAGDAYRSDKTGSEPRRGEPGILGGLEWIENRDAGVLARRQFVDYTSQLYQPAFSLHLCQLFACGVRVRAEISADRPVAS